MQEREITSRIRLDELQGLLDTEEPATKQRTTAPMPAVTLEELLQPEEPPAAVQVTFRSKRQTSGHILPRPSSAAPTLPGTMRRAAMGTPPPMSIAGLGAADDFDDDEGSSTRQSTNSERDGRDTVRVTVRDTIRMAAAQAAGILGTVNGVPVLTVNGVDSAMIAMGSSPEITPPSSIDAAIDAAIDAEIHNAEIDAAIDAVVLAPPSMMTKQRYGIVAMSFALSFIAGIIIMFLIA